MIKHKIVAARTVSPVVEWKFTQGITVRVKLRLTVTSNDAVIEAVLGGMGVTRLLSYQIASYVESSQLQVILTNFAPVLTYPCHPPRRPLRIGESQDFR